MNRNLKKPKVNKPWKPKDGGSHIRSEAEWKEMMKKPYVREEMKKEVEKVKQDESASDQKSKQ